MKRRHVLTAMATLSLCAVGAATALAGWPVDPAVNLPVADRPSEQVIPLVAGTSDGGCYIGWFDLASGNYDVYLQRLDNEGNELWPHNGILISNHPQNTWLCDWFLMADSGDNAVLAFVDTRAGDDWDVYACWAFTDKNGPRWRSPLTAKQGLTVKTDENVVLWISTPPPWQVEALGSCVLEVYAQVVTVDARPYLIRVIDMSELVVTDDAVPYALVTQSGAAAPTGAESLTRFYGGSIIPYTFGGELTNDPMGPVLDIEMWDNRIWGIDGLWWAFPITDVLTLLLTVALLIPQLNAFVRKSKLPVPEPQSFNVPPPPVKLG